jgi:hypothetical protein
LSSLLSALLAAGSPGPEALGTHNGTGEKPDFQVGGHCHALEVIGTALSKQIGVFHASSLKAVHKSKRIVAAGGEDMFTCPCAFR